MPLNVVFDHHAFCLQRVGGISRYFCEIAARMATRDDMTVSVLAPWHRNELLALSAAPTRGRFVSWPQSTYAALMALDYVATRWGARATRERAVVHETFYTWTKSNGVRGPRVTTVHDMIHERFRSQFSLLDDTALRKRRSIARADRVLCVSETTKRDLLEACSTDASRVSVVYHGCTLAEPGVIDAALVDRPFVLYVGSRGGYKNFAAMIAAFSSSARLVRDARVIAFGGGALTAEERAHATRCGLDERTLVQTSGDDSVLSALYHRASVTVVPSLYEGFGLPVIEAMRAGCPVAIADRGALPEIADGAAIEFDPTDRGAMRAAIERGLYGSGDERDERIAKGRTRAARFSWDRCAEETLAQYRAVW